MNSNDYWVEYWKDYTKNIMTKDTQTQVLRTLNKKPISADDWNFTLKTIEDAIEANEDDSLLELCCGNGLISKYLSTKVKDIKSVDISQELINAIDVKKYVNINTQVSDIRKLNYKKNSFDKIIIYAGIQYLTYSETILLLEQIYIWLKPNGILYLGDIPDKNKQWIFYNTSDREAVYFNNTKKGIDVVGTWFEESFFIKLGNFIGFKNSYSITQNQKLIYSTFRYDFKFVK